MRDKTMDFEQEMDGFLFDYKVDYNDLLANPQKYIAMFYDYSERKFDQETIKTYFRETLIPQAKELYIDEKLWDLEEDFV